MNIFKIIAITTLVFTTGQSYAKELDAIPNLTLESAEADASLNPGQSKFVFNLRNVELPLPAIFQYSIDGVTESATLTETMKVEVMTTPGKHLFQFYYNSDYYEVYSDSLEIMDQFTNNYGLYFRIATYDVMSEKPIIYLYPEQETEVSVKVDAKGELTFTYPDYGTGWNFSASPNGDLTFGENTYNYLFWESSESIAAADAYLTEGFRVEGKDATSFLKDKLTEAGLTSKEMTDFITYWGPRLAQNDANYVQFKFNETCNQFAELDITPKPDNLYRIYILWHPETQHLELEEQKIVPINREGFTVVEWGGQELPSRNDRSH